MSKKLVWIYSDIHSCNFVDTNIFGHSFVSKFSRMSHSGSDYTDSSPINPLSLSDEYLAPYRWPHASSTKLCPSCQQPTWHPPPNYPAWLWGRQLVAGIGQAPHSSTHLWLAFHFLWRGIAPWTPPGWTAPSMQAASCNADLQISKEILRNQCEKSDPVDLARLEEQVAKLEEGSQRAAVTLWNFSNCFKMAEFETNTWLNPIPLSFLM